jgi:hypothetical protein
MVMSCGESSISTPRNRSHVSLTASFNRSHRSRSV